MPEEALSLGVGLLGGSLNLGPSFLPTVLAISRPETALVVMSGSALVGVLLIAACARACGAAAPPSDDGGAPSVGVPSPAGD